MKIFRSFLILLCLLPAFKLSGQETPVEKGLRSITDEAIKAQLGFLASNWTEGRMIGERGASISADYIVSILQLCGVKPGGDFVSGRVAGSDAAKSERSWFQNFILLKTLPGEQELSLLSSEDNLVKTIHFNKKMQKNLEMLKATSKFLQN